MNQVYSPSQTKDWGFCPYYWEFRQRGWAPKRLGRKELAGVAGTGFAAGMAAYHLGQNPQDGAVSGLAKEWVKYRAAGAMFEDADPDIIQTKVLDALAKTIAFNPIPPTWQILDVERTLPDHGNARIDLGVHDGQGLAVADYKLKLSLQARYHDKEVTRYINDFKMLHYAWAYGQYKQALVERYYMLICILEPVFTVKVGAFSVHPQILQAWERGARVMWDMMGEHRVGGIPLWENPEHESKWGRCEFERACFDLKRDESLFFNEYINLKESHGPTKTEP